MSAQGLLSSVFSCSLSPKTITKQKLRQTRSLDPALMRHYGTGAEKTLSEVSDPIVLIMQLYCLIDKWDAHYGLNVHEARSSLLNKVCLAMILFAVYFNAAAT